jgi:type VI secretion system secreted protein Hcp
MCSIENTGRKLEYAKGYRMKALRNHLARNVLVAAALLVAAVAWGPVARSGTELVGAAATSGTPAFFDVFLDIAGIPGESTTPGHLNSIEVLSWSWGVTQGVSLGGSGNRGPLTGHVSLVKRIDKATPLLFLRCRDGTPITLATVQLTRTDGQTYMRYDLKNVMITAITHGDVNGDGVPDEKIDLDLNGGTLTYTPFDATGKPLAPISAQW